MGSMDPEWHDNILEKKGGTKKAEKEEGKKESGNPLFFTQRRLTPRATLAKKSQLCLKRAQQTMDNGRQYTICVGR